MEQLIQHRELIISAASKTSVTGAGDVMEDGAVEWLDKVAEIKAITQEVLDKRAEARVLINELEA